MALLAHLRAALFLLYCFVTVVPFAFAALPMWLAPPLMRFRMLRWWPRLAVYAARWILGVRWQVKGLEHLPKNGAIIMPKHQSTWETYFLCGFLEPYPVFVYKKELHWIPFFGWGIKSLAWVAIDRNQKMAAFEQVKAAGKTIVEGGRSVIMFPEGTRTTIGAKTSYKAGGTRLATAIDAPIVPIAHNAGALWPRGAWLKKSGLITVSIGPSIAAAGQTPEALLAQVEQWIEAEMNIISPEYYSPSNAKP
jgi:1-acyl-sn-glycerol-3-phosphate acyltransferase